MLMEIYLDVMQVKGVLGLEQCQGFYSGAAPLAQQTFMYFLRYD